MGYRSIVGIAIKKDKTTPEFLKLLDDADEKFEKGNILYFKYVCIKWYADSYEEIANIEAFLKDLEESDYGFIRIGEDPEDIEEEGEPDELGMYFTRDIDFDGV